MLGESGKDPRVIMPIESNAQYVEPGVLVFARGGALVGQSFNASTGQVAGEPFAIAESVRFFLYDIGRRFFRVAERVGGLSVSRRSIAPGMARPFRARESGRSARRAVISTCASSPDGRAALASRTLPATGTFDIWSFDLDRGTETRVTLDDAFTEIEGILVPGGDAMIFVAARGTAPRLDAPRFANRSRRAAAAARAC